MNKIHRVVWNSSKGCWMAAAETAHSRGPGGALVRLGVGLSMLAAALISQAGPPTTLPAGGNTRAYTAPNGATVVDIATPNAAGVSNNTYTQYNVNASGLVLNNGNTNQLTRQSTLAGTVYSNINLSNEARLILNQVVGANRSTLAGFTEVLGSRADVVVANPYGITCSGCGFLNTDRVTLTTGLPRMNPDGTLGGFSVTQGDIAVTGAGLNASAQQILDLVSRSVTVDGQINAPSVGIFAGPNAWDYGSRTVTGSTTPVGTAATYAIDSSLLGGMYANRIVLVSTEAGVGVRMLGEAAATAGDFSLTAAGTIELNARLSATGNLGLTAKGAGSGVQLADASLSAGADLAVVSDSASTFSGGALVAGNNLSVIASSLSDSAGTNTALQNNNVRYAGNALNVSVQGAAGIDGTQWGAGAGSWQGSFGSLVIGTTGATLYGGTSMSVAATNGGLALGKAQIKATGDLNIAATGAVSTAADAAQGVETTGGNLSITAGNGLANAGAISADTGSATLRIGQALVNSGQIYAKGSLAVTDAAGGGTESMANTAGGQILTDGALALKGGSVTNDAASRVQALASTVDADLFDNAGTWLLSNDAGTPPDSVTVSGTMSNSGTLQSANALTVNAGSANVTGKLVAVGNLDVTTVDAYTTGTGSYTQSGQALTIGAAGISNAGVLKAAVLSVTSSNGLTNTGTAQADTGGATVRASGTISNSGTLYAASTLDIADAAGGASETLTNSGTLQADGSMTVKAATTSNTGTGWVQAANGSNLALGSLNNSGMWLLSTGGAGTDSVSVSGALTDSGTLQSAHALMVQAASANVTGKLLAVANLDVTTVGAYTTDTGSYTQSGQTLTIGAAGISNAGMLKAATLNVTSSNGLTNTGTAQADTGNTTVRASGTISNSGTLYAASMLDIADAAGAASETLTNNGTIQSNGNLLLKATSATNNTGGWMQAASGSAITMGSLDNAGTWLLSTSGSGTDTVSLAGTLTNTGILQSAQAASIGASGMSVSGKLLSSGDMSTNVSGALTVNGGAVMASDATLGITGVTTLTNNAAGLMAGNKINISAATVNNSGTIQGGGATGSSLAATGTLTNSAGGVIAMATQAVGDGTVSGATLSNAGTMQSAGNMTVQTGGGDLWNRGTVLAQNGTLTLQPLAGASYNIWQYGTGLLQGGVLNVSANQLQLNDSSSLQSLGDMNVSLGSLSFGTPSTPRIVAGQSGSGTGTITLASALYNNAGIYSSGNLVVNAPGMTVTNTGGIAAAGNLTLQSAGDINNGGALFSGGSLTANANGYTIKNIGDTANGYTIKDIRDVSGPGTINAGTSLNLTAATVSNNSTIDSSGDITITAATIHNEPLGGDTRYWAPPQIITTAETGHDPAHYPCSNLLVCPDMVEVWYYEKTWSERQYYAGGAKTITNKPQIIGNGTVSLTGFNTATNLAGVISGGTVNMTGNPGSKFTNDDLALQQNDYTQTYEHYIQYIATGTFGTRIDNLDHNNSGPVLQGTTAFPSAGAGVFANQLSINNAVHLINNGISVPTWPGIVDAVVKKGSPQAADPTPTNYSATNGTPADPLGKDTGADAITDNTSAGTDATGSRTGSTSVGTGPAASVSFGGISIRLPTNPNGYFVRVTQPGAHYLVETNPIIGRLSAGFSGSNYILTQLGFNPDTAQTRLGDANYEAYLIQQQLIARTGSNLLAGFANQSAVLSALVQNGVAQAKSLGLTLGQAPTAQQLAGLSQDIVWLVSINVGGQQVLVPQVYLSSATIAGIQTGAVIAGNDVHMDLASLTNAGGVIKATNTLSVIAKGDIRNTSGTISAADMALVSTDGKIINETTVKRFGDSNNYQDVANKTGSITASKNLIVSGNQGVDIVGATVSAGTSAVVHSEKGNINIQSLVLDSKSTTETHTNGLFANSSQKTVETNQTRQAASVTVGDGKDPNAQLTLLAEKGNVNLTSADLTSSGGINIKANDVNSTVVNLEHGKTRSSESSGISGSGGALTVGSSSTHSEEKVSLASGSNINAGGALNVQAANNVTLEGGRYNAKTVSLEAGNDIITKAAKNTYSLSESSSSAGLTAGNGSIGGGAQASAANTGETTYTNAQITAADGAAINAKNKVDIGGVDVGVNVGVKAAALNKAPAQDNAQAGNAEAEATSDKPAAPKDNSIALGFDVAKLRSAAASGDTAALIKNTAANGMGTADAMAGMAKPEQGQLTISGAEIVSSKFKNEYQKTTESSGTYVGVGTQAQSSDTGASAGIGLSAESSYRKESSSEKRDNINNLSADNVALDGRKSIDLKGVAITGGSSISLKSDGNINISAAEVEKTHALESRSTHLNVGLEASANAQAPQVSETGPLPTLAGPVAASANLNFGQESRTINAHRNEHVDSTLSSGGVLSIQSGKGDVKFTGVTASADTLDIKADNFTSAAYKDSSTITESSTALGVNLTASSDLNKATSDLFRGNGAKNATLSRNETAEAGNTIVANTANIDVKNNVTLVGGHLAADNLNIKANTVDIQAAKSTLDERKTEVGALLTMDGSAAFMGNKAYASIDSMKGKAETGVSQGNGLADRTGDGRVNNGKAVSDELLSGKAGLTINSKEETTKSTTYNNATLQFKNLNIDTTAAAGSTKGDGHVDIGGANLLATTDKSSINITTGELKTTKYVDKIEKTSHDNSTFIGVATEAHSAVADTVNHSKTLDDKAKEGMTVDPGWAAAQAAGDATNMAMGDAVGGSIAATVRNIDTRTQSVSTSENINYINAGNISIKTTQGNLALNGVEFNAPPTVNKDTGAPEKASGPRPKSISLDSAKDIKITAAKSTYTETSTTLTNDVNLTASGSISGSGSGAGVDAGHNGSIEQNSLAKTTYSNASVNADNVSIKSKNLTLTGANVSGANVSVNVENNIDITSVQDTQVQKTTRSNWGGSAGLKSVNGQGGGGESHDNSAITARQSGIAAENQLSVSAGGNLTLTGAHIASAGSGTVDVKGNVTANKLDDFREKDGLFAGGSGGIHKGGVNVGVNLEKVDQVHNATTQNSIISGVSLQVGGKIQGDNLQADGSLQTKATTVLKDEKIAGVYVNGTGVAKRPQSTNRASNSHDENTAPRNDGGADQLSVKAPQAKAPANAGMPDKTGDSRPDHQTANAPETSVDKNTASSALPKETAPDLAPPKKSDDAQPDPNKNDSNNIASSKYDFNVVIITRDKNGAIDKVVEESAQDLAKKHPENTVVLIEKKGGGFENPEALAGAKGKIRVNTVGHGSDLKDQSQRIANLVEEVGKEVGKNKNEANIEKVGLVACGECSKSNGQSLAESVVGLLHEKGITTTVTERSAGVQVNKDGTKSQYDGEGKQSIKYEYSMKDGEIQETPIVAKRQELSALDRPLVFTMVDKEGGKDEINKVGKDEIDGPYWQGTLVPRITDEAGIQTAKENVLNVIKEMAKSDHDYGQLTSYKDLVSKANSTLERAQEVQSLLNRRRSIDIKDPEAIKYAAELNRQPANTPVPVKNRHVALQLNKAGVLSSEGWRPPADASNMRVSAGEGARGERGSSMLTHGPRPLTGQMLARDVTIDKASLAKIPEREPMKGVMGESAAEVSGIERSEWLHALAHSLGGADRPTDDKPQPNIVAGPHALNTAMIPFERLVLSEVQKGRIVDYHVTFFSDEEGSTEKKIPYIHHVEISIALPNGRSGTWTLDVDPEHRDKFINRKALDDIEQTVEAAFESEDSSKRMRPAPE